MSESRYRNRPKADQDLDDQAYYYATTASVDVGHRFLVAAHDTFSLLATQPDMGWDARLKHPSLKFLRVFRVTGSREFLCCTGPGPMAWKSCAWFTVRGICKDF